MMATLPCYVNAYTVLQSLRERVDSQLSGGGGGVVTGFSHSRQEHVKVLYPLLFSILSTNWQCH